MANLIDSLKAKLKKTLDDVTGGSLSDNKGWVREGKFTPVQQIQDIRAQAKSSPVTTFGPLTVPNYNNPQGQDAWKSFGKGFVNSATFGLVNPKYEPQTNYGKYSNVVGNVAGLFTPSSPAAMGMRAVDKLAGEGIIKLAPRLTSTLAGKVAAGVSKEAAQTLAYAGASKLASGLGLNDHKDQFSPKNLGANLALGSVFRGALSPQGQSVVGNAVKKVFGGNLYESDLREIRDTIDGLAREARSGQPSMELRKVATEQGKAFNKAYNIMPEKQWNKLSLESQYKLLQEKVMDMRASGQPILMGIKSSKVSTPSENVVSTASSEATQAKNGMVKLKISNPKGSYTGPTKDLGLSSSGQLPGKPVSEIPIRTKANSEVSLPSIEKGKLNINRLNVKGDGKDLLLQLESQVPPTVIGNKEIVDASINAKGTGTMTDEQMKKVIANQLKNRQVVVDLTKQYNQAKASGAPEIELGRIMLRIAEQSRTARQGGTFAGRLLQAQNIVADQSATPMQKIMALLDNAGVKEEEYLKDAVKVDWENPAQVVSFYRKYVPPKLGEVLDEVRYSNMLSSPLTHITNIAGNAIQTALVAPIEKTVTGVLDWGKSALTGSERKYYATAGIDYAGGYVKSVPQAFKKAWDVLSGQDISIRPDYENIPTGSTGLMKAYTTPLRALEAMDRFFGTLVEGGVANELQKGPQKLKLTQVADAAKKEADYRLFRQAFDPNGELGSGTVLKYFDKWNSAISNLRRLPGGKWILPFLQTPTNILKQGLEYSPLGVTTAIGAKNPLEQISKSLIGTTVFAGAYSLAKGGLVQWGAPTGEKERELYYAAGMQPYSVKVGNNWVSFSKLGPLSYPFAMAAALADAEKKNPDQSYVSNVGKSISGMLSFFGDQSYVRSIGDLIEAIQGGVNVGPNAVNAEAANLVGQLIPYKSFMTWLGRITDPVYRKANNFTERMSKDMPVVGSNLEPYVNTDGQPSKRDYPVLNAVSPYKVTKEKTPESALLQEYQQKKVEKGIQKRADDKFSSGDVTQQRTGSLYRYIDDNGEVKTIDLSFPVGEYKPTGNKALDKELLSDYKSSITKAKNNVMKALEVGAITQEEAVSQLEKLQNQSNKVKKSKKLKVSKTTPLKSIKVKSAPRLQLSQVNISTPKVQAISPPKRQKLKVKKLPKVNVKIKNLN